MVDIYLITNNINGKRYVGKTQRGYLLRFQEHCNAKKNGFNTYIGNAIDKYGKENFSIELLKTVDDDSWEYWEKYYIQEYKTLYSQGGYNLTPGGDANPMDIPEIREKHLNSCRTAEHREKISRAVKGREVSVETRNKIRENNLKNLDAVVSGLRKYNNSKKVRVGIIEGDDVIQEFDSIADACKFVGTPSTNAGCILERCDSFNKNGKRSRIYGYSWTKL